MNALRLLRGGKDTKSIEGKLPPCCISSEEILIGIILCGAVPISAISDIITTPECFYSDQNRRLWEACLLATKNHGCVDLVLAHAALNEQGNGALQTHAMEIIAFANENAEVTSERKARLHAETVRSRWVQRLYCWELLPLLGEAYTPTESPATLIDGAIQRLDAIRKSADAGPVELISCEAAAKRTVTRLQSPRVLGIHTGMPSIDRILGDTGLVRKEVSVLAARTSVGKSMLANQWAMGVAKAGHAVVYISLEMNHELMNYRQAAFLSGVSHMRIMDQRINQSEWSLVMAALAEMSKLDIFTSASMTLSISQIGALCSKVAKQRAREHLSPIGLIVVDYIGLVQTDDMGRVRTREAEIAGISRRLRTIADDINAHVLALAQINREAEKAVGNGMPKLHQLRDSGAIEQDADNIFLLHRPRNADGFFDDNVPATLALAKARSRCPSAVRLRCEPDRMRFSDL